MMTHTHKGHCQRCGSIQAASNGSNAIAKHGYKVAGFGFFMGTCDGSGRLPMQIERTLTDETIATLRDMAEGSRIRAAQFESGTVKPDTVKGPWNKAEQKYSRVPFDTAPVWEQRDEVRMIVANLQSDARHADSHASMLTTLAAQIHGSALIENRDTKPAPVSIIPGAKFIENGVEWTILRERQGYRTTQVVCKRTRDGLDFPLSAQRVRKALRAAL